MAAHRGTTVLRTAPGAGADRGRQQVRVLVGVLLLNLLVAGAKVTYGLWSGAVSILSDGVHSLADSVSNVVALVGVRAARAPADASHPYGHRKFETLATVGILVFLMVALVQIVEAAIGRLFRPEPVSVTTVSFAVMAGTLLINLVVVRYEARAGRRLQSEVLLADAHHTRSDVYTSLAVIAGLAGVAMGWPVLDPIVALVVAVFIGRAVYAIARQASDVLADRAVLPEDPIRRAVMTVPEVLGCHQIRTRGSADHAFLDLHVWFRADMPLIDAHRLSHVVKDRLMETFPTLQDVVIHIEPK
ncbi:MAG TPA: cation diffusion facilitator family transporter [Vicinamibacterales bacterium]|nr:cation diffusion facilitator family transporter [Vicinamibacterales bacterium]